MKILLLGDAHGALYVLADISDTAVRMGMDAIIQVGDFGFFPHFFRMYFGERITKKSVGFSLPIYAIDGNHENHAWLYKQNKELWKEHLNLHFVNRGEIIKFGSSNIAFLGGALNIDRKQTITVEKGTNIYDSKGLHNFTLNSEKDLLLEKVNKIKSGVNVIVTHTCPCSIGVGMHKSPYLMQREIKYVTSMGVNTGPFHDSGEQVLTDLWNGLIHKPKHWVFGHYHSRQQKKVNGTLFSCVGCIDGSDGKDSVLPFIYDTETKDMEVLVHTPI